MKVAVVSHFENIDEGTRIVAKEIAKNLERRGLHVKKVNISSRQALWVVRKFQPDVTHFILSPTVFGLIFSKIVSLSYPKTRTVISAVQSAIPKKKIVSAFRPDIILVQSEESEIMYKDLGFNTLFLPNGVDTAKFKPVSMDKKLELRKKYDLPLDKFIVLHLASMKRKRNLEVFKTIKKHIPDVEIVIVGRDNEKNIDWKLVKELRGYGCKVWIKHFSRIEEIHQLADCYVFPTTDKTASIETPLSVLEAMACNLPVITTKFGALPRMFDGGDGLFFVESKKDIVNLIRNLQIEQHSIKIKNREKVMKYSWDLIVSKLVSTYKKLIGDAL